MKRSEFLKKIGLGAAVAAAGPAIVLKTGGEVPKAAPEMGQGILNYVTKHRQSYDYTVLTGQKLQEEINKLIKEQ